jgi:hypothetical protein
MIAYQRSHHENWSQQLLSMYWVSCGVPSKAFDLLHVTGLAMSADWTRGAIRDLAAGGCLSNKNRVTE